MSSSGLLPAGTVTFLFTDIEGSTQLLKRLGGERYGDALADHQRILRELFEKHAGPEIDTQGDSFFVAFRRTTAGGCDPSIDAKMARATALQATNLRAATLLRHEIEDELLAVTPLLPTANHHVVDFTSKRVGNYQGNPQSGVLLSQLWVR